VTERGAGLVAKAREGDTHATARLLSVVENEEPGAAEALRELYPLTGKARVIGVTGPPGGGKSTLVNRLAGAYREQGERVAVVAVDPSSPFSGGALLGDRIRMSERFLDEGLFIRSMASRGSCAPSPRPARTSRSWSRRSSSTAPGLARTASAIADAATPRGSRSRICSARR